MTPSPVPYKAAAIAVDLDLTLLGQVVIFVLLILILRPLLIEPVLRIFEERERRTSGARAEARQMQERTGELLRRYETEYERVRQLTAQERDKMRVELARLEAQLIGDAREAAKQIVTQGRLKIEQEVQAVRFDLGAQSEQIGVDLARAVLGREIR
jgi:F-type H+-transporting ATPase subunit b